MYGANRLLALPGIFFRGYFNDILAGCMILAIANLLLALARLKPWRKLWQCLGLSLAAGLFWEIVTPWYLARSTADPWDIAAYMAGGLIWYLLCRIWRQKTRVSD